MKKLVILSLLMAGMAFGSGMFAQIIDFESATGYQVTKRTADTPEPVIVDNPLKNSLNNSDKVLKFDIPDTAVAWAGIHIFFDEPYELSVGSRIKIKILREQAGKVRIDIKNPVSGTLEPRYTIQTNTVDEWNIIEIEINEGDQGLYNTMGINPDQGGTRDALKTIYIDDVEIKAPVNTGGDYENLNVIPTSGDNYYRVKAMKKSDGTYLLAGGGYNGEIAVYTSAGAKVWKTKADGFIFAMESIDLDGDGDEDLLVGSSDTKLYAYKSDGELLWEVKFQAPLQAITAGKTSLGHIKILAGSANDELKLVNINGSILKEINFSELFSVNPSIIRDLETGSFTAAGQDEFLVAAMPSRNKVVKFILDMNTLLNKTPLPGGVELLESSRDDNGYNGFVADFDGDGIDEIVSQHGIDTPGLYPYTLKTFNTNLVGGDFLGSKYRMMIPVVGDFHPNPGKEIFAIYGHEYFIYNKDGVALTSLRGQQGFTDVDVIPASDGGLDAVILGSSPNGDDNLYYLQFVDGESWKNGLINYIPSAVTAKIDQTFEEYNDLIDNWEGQTIESELLKINLYPSPATFLKDESSTLHQIGLNAAYLEERTAIFDEPVDPRRDDFKSYQAILNDVSIKYVSNDEAFHLYVGHGPTPHISKELFADILNNANGLCFGADVREGDMEDWEYYLPMMEAAQQQNIAFEFLGKKGVWAFAAHRETLEKLTAENRKQSFSPSGEDSDAIVPELDYAGRIGLWKAGEAGQWGFKVMGDQFNFNRLWDWEYPLHGHLYLRTLLNNVSMGAEIVQMMYYAQDDDIKTPYQKGVDLFIKMFEKGIIGVPSKDQIKSFSPVVIAGEDPVDRIMDALTVSNAVSFSPSSPDQLISRLDHRWGMAPLYENDLLRKVYNSQRRGHNFLPHNDFGLVTWVQFGVDEELKSSMNAEVVWHTDGGTLTKNGVPGTLEDLLADMEAEADKLPFQVTGDAAWNVIKLSNQEYHIILIDPGYLDPQDRTVILEANQTANWTVRDRLRQSDMGTLGSGISVDIPAGAFRILEVSTTDNVGIKNDWEKKVVSVKVYPNPAKDELNIELSQEDISNPYLTIFDGMGRAVDTYILDKVHNKINIESFSPGIYLLNIYDMNKGVSKKILIK